MCFNQLNVWNGKIYLEKSVSERESQTRKKSFRKKKIRTPLLKWCLREREARGFVLSFLSREGQDKINIKRKNSSFSTSACVWVCVSCVSVCVLYVPAVWRIKPKHNNSQIKVKIHFCFSRERFRKVWTRSKMQDRWWFFSQFCLD